MASIAPIVSRMPAARRPLLTTCLAAGLMACGWPIAGPGSSLLLGPLFRVAPDGAICGTTASTAYKLH